MRSPVDGVALPRNQKRGMILSFTKETRVYFCVTKSTKSQKEEGNSCLGDADTHAARMCQFLF